MFWLTVRQFRAQAVVATLALAALAVVVILDAHQVLDAYHHAAAFGTLNDFLNQYAQLGIFLDGLVLVVPGLIGVFWGAPLLARELEAGTFRLAWTQSVSRTRWTVCKLAVLGLAAMAVAGLCSLLVTWWASTLDLAAGTGPFAHFDMRGFVPAAYAAFAFSLGVAAGALIRRTVAAMGATLVVFAGLRVAFLEWVRPHLMAPLTARSPFTIDTAHRIQVGASLPHGAWIVSEAIANRAGHTFSGGAIGIFGNLSSEVGPAGVTIPGVGSCPNLRFSGNVQSAPGLMARCVDQLHLSNVVTYQPASRYWPFQTYESLIFLAAAVAVGACTVWWVRRLN